MSVLSLTVQDDFSSAAEAPVAPAPSRRSPPLELCVTGGLHRSARRRLPARGVLMLGAAADCDLILSDPGVGARHCLLSRSREGVSLRALDSPLRIDDRELPPGESASLAVGAQVGLGEARLSLARIDGSDAAPAGDAAATPGALPSWRERPLWAAAGAGLVLAVAAAAGLWMQQAQRDELIELPAPAAQARRALQDLGLKEVEVSTREDGRPVVRGVVPDERAATRLRRHLQLQAPDTQLQLRLGKAIAEDVREILRLQGIEAQTRYLGEGRVEVRGRLGDESALAAVIRSRAMSDIDGLRQVVAVNLDGASPRPAPAARRDERKRVVTVVSGRDPYIVTADGARYFVGARLPGGARLAAVENNEILLHDGTHTQRRAGVGTVLGEG